MKLKISKDYSTSPGPRYTTEGKFSGEEFRKNILLPKVKEAISCGDKLIIDLDGTSGFGTSFLEEAFGGLIREDRFTKDTIDRTIILVSTEEPELIDEIEEYIKDADDQGTK